jgi:hypothetical protein
MPLAQEDYAAIGEYVRTHLSAWLTEQSPREPASIKENVLLIRMTRLEEELSDSPAEVTTRRMTHVCRNPGRGSIRQGSTER